MATASTASMGCAWVRQFRRVGGGGHMQVRAGVVCDTARAPSSQSKTRMTCLKTATHRVASTSTPAARAPGRKHSFPRRSSLRVNAVADSDCGTLNDEAFCASDYHRVQLRYIVPSSAHSSPPEGTLVITLHGDTEPAPETPVLLMDIAGDTLTALLALARGTTSSRPHALQVLWELLADMRERRGVALTHVAVTSMRDEVFHGRLFFSEPSSSDGGAPPSAEAALECESKASDALWLALTTGAPVLMHKAVWDACALPLQRVLTNTAAALVEEQAAELVVPRVTAAAAAAEERPRLQLTQAAATDAEVTGAEGGEASEPIELNANATEAASEQSEALYTVYDTVAMEDSLREIQTGDPEPIKRLKRELHVAVGEEDYAAAARLRDHPFMRLYAQLKSAEAGGHFAQGKALRHELLHLITSQQQLNAAHMSLTGALKAFRVEHSLEAQM